jgi:hypothetical protein
MNPKKCAFGVSAGQFLGFLMHERGIEIGLKIQEAVKNDGATYYKEGAPAAYWQNQLCQKVYFQSLQAD